MRTRESRQEPARAGHAAPALPGAEPRVLAGAGDTHAAAVRVRAAGGKGKASGWRWQVGAAGARVGAGARTEQERRRGWELLGLLQESGSKAATHGARAGTRGKCGERQVRGWGS